MAFAIGPHTYIFEMQGDDSLVMKNHVQTDFDPDPVKSYQVQYNIIFIYYRLERVFFLVYSQW